MDPNVSPEQRAQSQPVRCRQLAAVQHCPLSIFWTQSSIREHTCTCCGSMLGKLVVNRLVTNSCTKAALLGYAVGPAGVERFWAHYRSDLQGVHRRLHQQSLQALDEVSSGRHLCHQHAWPLFTSTGGAPLAAASHRGALMTSLLATPNRWCRMRACILKPGLWNVSAMNMAKLVGAAISLESEADLSFSSAA